MSYLLKYRKEELRALAIELGEEVTPDSKALELNSIILNSKAYEEKTARVLLDTIKNERVEREEIQRGIEQMEHQFGVVRNGEVVYRLSQ